MNRSAKNTIHKPNKMIRAGQNLTTIQAKIMFSILARFKYLAGTESIEELERVTYSIPIAEVFPSFVDSIGGNSYKLL